MLGLHVQYAQQEARSDLGRVLGAVALLVIGLLLLFMALLLGHAGLVFYLSRAVPGLGAIRAALLVAGADLVLGLLALLAGRARLSKPVLQQTRALIRRTVSSLTEP
jgi:hypothetical protein